jgi:hypothetical protein
MEDDAEAIVAAWRTGKPAALPAALPPRESEECLANDLRIQAVVRALVQGRDVTKLAEDWGQDVVDDGRVLWESLESNQREVRAWATAALVGVLQDEDRKVRVSAANSLLTAADRAVMTRSRYDDLSDPQTRQAAVHELRHPSAGLQQVILEAWSKPQVGAIQVLVSLLGSPHPALLDEMSRLGWRRGSGD